MNKTTNYQLNQWEAEDQVRRTDFNEDNAKIDAAIKAVDQKADGKADAADLAAVQKQTAGLQTSLAAKGTCTVVAGTYAGDGATAQLINLGRRPKAVLVFPADGRASITSTGYSGLAVEDGNCAGKTSIITLNDSGFTVYQATATNYSSATNLASFTYHYIAFFW